MHVCCFAISKSVLQLLRRCSREGPLRCRIALHRDRGFYTPRKLSASTDRSTLLAVSVLRGVHLSVVERGAWHVMAKRRTLRVTKARLSSLVIAVISKRSGGTGKPIVDPEEGTTLLDVALANYVMRGIYSGGRPGRCITRSVPSVNQGQWTVSAVFFLRCQTCKRYFPLAFAYPSGFRYITGKPKGLK
jgi:hypothetical protein